MDILFVQYLIRNLGLIFTLIFLFYLCLMSIRLIKIYNVLRYVPKEKGTNPNSNIAQLFKGEFELLIRACSSENNILIESRIEQLWIEYEERVQVHFSAINGYIYALILWGFTGTIWGTIQTFSKMGESLFQKDVKAAEALSAALQGGLNIALYTSLAAATIGAVMVTYIYSKYMFEKSKRLESEINSEICRIVEQGEDGKEGAES